MDSASTRLLVMVGGALLVVGSVFAWRSVDSGTTAPPRRPDAHSQAASASHGFSSSPSSSQASVEPSAENVAPSVRQRMERLRRRVEATPSDTAARRALGDLLFKAHEPGAAAEHYRAYLERRPQHRQTWLDLTNAYGRVQKWKQALQVATRMLEHFPHDAAALYNAGAAAANLQRYTAARRYWQRALKNKPSTSVQTKTETALQRLDSLSVAASTNP